MAVGVWHSLALLLLYHLAGVRIAASSPLGADGLSSISLNDPEQAGQQLTLTASALSPRVECTQRFGLGRC